MMPRSSSSITRLPGYIPSLDGWRAISILLVIFYHAKFHSDIPVFASVFRWTTDNGGVGVNIFFVISGILITGRLLEEEERQGAISLRRFYLRRVFRIVPPVLLYLGALAILVPVIGTGKLEFVSCLLFFRNYVLRAENAHNWYTGHFWSLSVEEHFYLLLPSILVFFRRSRAWILAGMSVAVAGWRFWLFHSGGTDVGVRRTDTVLDMLLIPALFAVALQHPGIQSLFRKGSNSAVTLVLAGGYVALIAVRWPLGPALPQIWLTLIVLSTVWAPHGLLTRFLECAPLKWIGRISYSLYLWQQIFFPVRVPVLHVSRYWELNIVGLIACACFSYYVVERPMIRLGHKLASSGVPGRKTDEPAPIEAAPARLQA